MGLSVCTRWSAPSKECAISTTNSTNGVEDGGQRLEWPRTLAAALASAALVLIARWWLIAALGSPVPYLDQWDAEALEQYVGMSEGSAGWGDWSRAHNEHRPVLTNLWNVGLFAWGGGWDPILQMMANAIWPAVTVGLAVGWLLRRRSGIGWRLGVIVGATAWGALPIGYQNTLWGFQSQFHFVVLASVVALVGLQGAAGRSAEWWVGLAAALLAPLAMAAGALVGPVVWLVAVLRWWWQGERLPVVGWLAAGSGFVIWVLFLRESADGHAPLVVGDVVTWSAVWMTAMSWPWAGSVVGWLIGLGPVLWLLMRGLRGRQVIGRVEWGLIGVAGWSVAAMMAMAYLRGGAVGSSFQPASRYLDVVVPGVVASGLIVAWMRDRVSRLLRWLWLAFVVTGVAVESVRFMQTTAPAIEVVRQVTVEAALMEVQGGGTGASLQAVGSHPSAAVISAALAAGREGNWLPPILTAPPRALWDLNGALGTALGAEVAGGGLEWVSPMFRLERGGAYGLVDGQARVTLVSAEGQRIELPALARELGPWTEMGAVVAAGDYRLHVGEVPTGESVTVLWPRDVSAVSIFVRQVLAQTGWSLGLVMAGWVFVLALEIREGRRAHFTVMS